MVTLQTALLMLLQALLISAIFVAAFVVSAWLVAGKLGPGSLWAWWLAVAAGVSAVVLHRSHLLDSGGRGPAQLWLGGSLAGMLFLAFGLCAYSVQRSRRNDPQAGLTVGVVGRGQMAFYGGLALVPFVYIVLDVRRLLAQ